MNIKVNTSDTVNMIEILDEVLQGAKPEMRAALKLQVIASLDAQAQMVGTEAYNPKTYVAQLGFAQIFLQTMLWGIVQAQGNMNKYKDDVLNEEEKEAHKENEKKNQDLAEIVTSNLRYMVGGEGTSPMQIMEDMIQDLLKKIDDADDYLN